VPSLFFQQTQIPSGLQATFDIRAFGRNDLGNPISYNQMVATVANFTAGNEAALCRYNAYSQGTFKTYFEYDGNADEAAFNETLNMNGNNIISVNDVTLQNTSKIEVAGASTTFDIVNDSQGTGLNISVHPGETIFFKNLNLQNGVDVTFPFAGTNNIGSSLNKLGTLYTNTTETGALQNPATGQINVAANLDMFNNQMLAMGAINGNEGFIDFNFNPNELIVNGNNNLKLTSTGEIRLQNQVVYVPDGQMITSVAPDTTYVFLGDRTITTPIVINQPGVKFKGTGRDNSSITLTGALVGGMIQVFDQDFEIADITLSAQGDQSYAIYGTNINAGTYNDGRTKILNITNCQFRNCKNGMLVEGFDLVDISQTLFFYFEAQTVPTSQFGLSLLGCSKIEINSCEFLRWFDETTIPTPGNFFTGNMITLDPHPSGVQFGATVITNNLFHPQQNQNGLVISNTATFGFANLVGNSFIDINLNTPTYLPLVIDINLQPSWIIEANQGVPNYLAFINSEVNANALVTTIGAVSTPTAILATTFINYFTINLNLQFTIQAGGNNQNIEIGLFRNGVPSGPTTKVEADSAVPANASLNIIGFADQGDTFQLYIQNDTGANDILVNNIQLAGVEA
jgi:hypothetical protein